MKNKVKSVIGDEADLMCIDCKSKKKMRMSNYCIDCKLKRQPDWQPYQADFLCGIRSVKYDTPEEARRRG